ncbi:hypothetical protein ABT373_03860 [Streptomyces sp. NPDC000070]|uniref:hypothetical protein n=1 Tax=Streptomyces sp. NPDC000070 TaxID=3154240 RepID=UPI003320C610
MAAARRLVVDRHVRIRRVLTVRRDDRHAHQLRPPLLLLADREGQDDDCVDLAAGWETMEEVVAVLDAVQLSTVRATVLRTNGPDAERSRSRRLLG